MEDDEAIVLASATLGGLISREQSLAISRKIGNRRYPKIIDRLLSQ